MPSILQRLRGILLLIYRLFKYFFVATTSDIVFNNENTLPRSLDRGKMWFHYILFFGSTKYWSFVIRPFMHWPFAMHSSNLFFDYCVAFVWRVISGSETVLFLMEYVFMVRRHFEVYYFVILRRFQFPHLILC